MEVGTNLELSLGLLHPRLRLGLFHEMRDGSEEGVGCQQLRVCEHVVLLLQDQNQPTGEHSTVCIQRVGFTSRSIFNVVITSHQLVSVWLPLKKREAHP